MKKIILCIIFLLILSGLIFAQEQNQTEEKHSSTPLKFLYKPNAVYPKEAKKKQIEGEVRLRITFQADSEIGEINDITEENNQNLEKFGLIKAAIDAAKLIKFVPATESGTPVTLKKVVVYVFSFF